MAAGQKKAVGHILSSKEEAGTVTIRDVDRELIDHYFSPININIEVVRESWREQLGQEKIERIRQNVEAAKEQEKENAGPKRNEYDMVRLACRILTEQESTFSKEDVLLTAGKLSVGKHDIEDLEGAFEKLESKNEIKTLDAEKGIYTTAEMEKIERDIVSKVQKGHDSVESIMSKEQAQQGIEDFEKEKSITMTEGQKKAVEHILTSKDRYIGIQGDKWTGKTTMLTVVREQLEREGYTVVGLSFTGKAALEIEQNSGIKSQTIDSFLAGRSEESQNQIWIIDEASMLGSRKKNDLMTVAEKVDTRVVFIDNTERPRAVESDWVIGTQDQKEIDYEEIVKDFSEGRIDRAFEKLESSGRIFEISNRQERLDAIVKDYTSRDYKDTLVVTVRNKDRNELNEAIRGELKDQGKLSRQEYTFTVRESKGLSPIEKHFGQSYKDGDRVIANKAGVMDRAGNEGKVTSVDQQNHRITVESKDRKMYFIDLKLQGQDLAVYSEKQQSFSQGDKIIFLKNDKSLGIVNNQAGEIKFINESGKMTVLMETGEEKTINLNTQYNYIDHGYVITSSKAQWQTSKETIYHAETERRFGSKKGVNYNQMYVVLTRAKEDLRIFTNNKKDFKDQIMYIQVKTSTFDYGAGSNG